MQPAVPPMIFAPRRRAAARRRMALLQQQADAPRYIFDDMVEDVRERLAFLRHEPRNALVLGDPSGESCRALKTVGTIVTTVGLEEGFDEEQPWPVPKYDLIVALGTLDTVNDLPGALIHMRAALAPGGLAIAEFAGAGSLPLLRAAMAAADGDRPSPRLHPQVDVRAAGQLLQRAGFADPVVDSRSLDVAYRSFDRLVGDLRAMGLSNVLADPGPPLGKAARDRARAAFAAAGAGGRSVERFEILTLSGWRHG